MRQLFAHTRLALTGGLLVFLVVGCGGGPQSDLTTIAGTSALTAATTATTATTAAATTTTAAAATTDVSTTTLVASLTSSADSSNDPVADEMKSMQTSSLSASSGSPPGTAKAALSIGAPLPEASASPVLLAEFTDGQANFAEHESLFNTGDPVGPIANGISPNFTVPKSIGTASESTYDVQITIIGCATCHSSPATGGGSDNVETRAGVLQAGVFSTIPGTSNGTLFHNEFFGRESAAGAVDTTTGGVSNPFAPNFFDPLISPPTGFTEAFLTHGEVIPSVPNEVIAGRIVPNVFGFGLIEAIPDDEIEEVAAVQRRVFPNQAGQVVSVTSPAFGTTEVGRFGWKCQEADLLSFSGDAYFNEMDVSNGIFPFKNETPNAAPVSVTLAQVDDQGAGPTSATRLGNDNGARDIDRFTNFMRFLAPVQGTHAVDPSAGLVLTGAAARGFQQFQTMGCAVCHVPFYTTRSPIAALNNKTVFAFSDFLVHDVFPDNIQQGNCPPNKTRTAPLMGLSTNQAFLHDGSAHTVTEAILKHAGQATEARQNFQRLSPTQQAELLQFLNNI